MRSPHAERLMKRPLTTACLVVVVDKPLVRRTRRVIRVRPWMCWRSMVGVCCLPTVCGSGVMCRSYAPQPSVENRVMPNGSSRVGSSRKTASCRRPKTPARSATPALFVCTMRRGRLECRGPGAPGAGAGRGFRAAPAPHAPPAEHRHAAARHAAAAHGHLPAESAVTGHPPAGRHCDTLTRAAWPHQASTIEQKT